MIKDEITHFSIRVPSVFNPWPNLPRRSFPSFALGFHLDFGSGQETANGSASRWLQSFSSHSNPFQRPFKIFFRLAPHQPVKMRRKNQAPPAADTRLDLLKFRDCKHPKSDHHCNPVFWKPCRVKNVSLTFNKSDLSWAAKPSLVFP
jgi:hypothetical protein